MFEIKQESMNGRVKFIQKTKVSETAEKKNQLQSKLTALTDKKTNGELTIDDIFEQNQLIIEMLELQSQ